MLQDHNDIANHCLTEDINMASDGYQYRCRQKDVITLTHSFFTHTHTHTWSQLTGAKDIAVGVKFFCVFFFF